MFSLSHPPLALAYVLVACELALVAGMALTAAAASGGDAHDDEYAKLVRGMNPPRVVVDNEACDEATVIRVDSVSSHGTLLAVVQVIADLGLVIRKAYFSSDGSWFMDGQSLAAVS